MPRFFRVIFRIFGTLLGVVLAGMAAVLGAVVYFNAPPDKPVRAGDTISLTGGGAVLVEVREGESAAAVGRRLELAGLIKNRHFWNLLYYLDRQHIKTGIYKLTIPASQLDIRSILISGRQVLTRITIPEGITLKKAARILAAGGICGEEDFLAAAANRETLDAYHVPGETMEGYLYPDTYFFPRGYPAPLVIKTMADTFFERLAEIDPGAPALSPRELNDRVIIASIVEREYRLDTEAALMAGVFYNRLNIGMALQSCATVEYVITEIQGRPHPEALYNRDIEIRDPYNTYARPGLPPGPISSPGSVALDAAFHPLPSDYLYFRLVDPSAGRHYFSTTLDDHIRAGGLYVKRSASY
jgi:UPF0755 protein